MKFKWKRHRYAVGAVDIKTGKVMECHTEKQLAAWDYNRDFTFSYEQGSAMNTGESLEFCIDEDGNVVFDRFDVEVNNLQNEIPRLTEKVMEQIKIS